MPHSDHFIDGVKIPSVTQITGMLGKSFLYGWYGKYGNRLCMKKLKLSGVIGDLYHIEADNIVNGVKHDPGTRRLRGMCVSFEKWVIENQFKPEVQEFDVTSKVHRYAGTLDAIGTLGNDKELVILDWKSSAGIYPEMAYQLAAYAAAYEEQQGIKLNKGWIIQVDKKPPYSLHTKMWDNLDQKFECFLGLLKVYNDLHPVKEKKVKVSK
jgi:hypothetical protein